MKKNLTILIIVSILIFGAIAISADTDKTVAVQKATVGEMAPNFTLKDSNGKTHSLFLFNYFIQIQHLNSTIFI